MTASAEMYVSSASTAGSVEVPVTGPGQTLQQVFPWLVPTKAAKSRSKEISAPLQDDLLATQRIISSLREVVLALRDPSSAPWVALLPEEDVRAFVVEIMDVLDACDGVHDLTLVEPVLAAWRHTAEVHGNPTLHEVLTRDLDDGDFGDVPAP